MYRIVWSFIMNSMIYEYIWNEVESTKYEVYNILNSSINELYISQWFEASRAKGFILLVVNYWQLIRKKLMVVLILTKSKNKCKCLKVDLDVVFRFIRWKSHRFVICCCCFNYVGIPWCEMSTCVICLINTWCFQIDL